MILYHGTTVDIKEIDLQKSKPNLHCVLCIHRIRMQNCRILKPDFIFRVLAMCMTF